MKELIEITDPEILAGEELPGHYYSNKNDHWWTKAINAIKRGLSYIRMHK